AGRERLRVAGRAAEPRRLVHRESDAVAESVHVAFLRSRMAAHGGVATRLVQVAHLLLIGAARLADLERAHRHFERVLAVAVHLAQVVARLPHAERAREVAVVAAPRFTGEDVDDHRRAGTQLLGVLAAVVRNARIASLRDDALARL